jgi:hypothetical protein
MKFNRRLWTVLFLLPVAVGCDRASEPGASAAATASTGSVRLAGREGDWFVVAVNGSPMTREPITVRIDKETIKGQSGCVEFEWLYTTSQSGFRTANPPEPRAVCERGRSGWETAFEDALADASSLELISEETLQIGGSGGAVTLRRVGSSSPESVQLAPPAKCDPSPARNVPDQVTVVKGPAGPLRLVRSGVCSSGGHRLAPPDRQAGAAQRLSGGQRTAGRNGGLAGRDAGGPGSELRPDPADRRQRSRRGAGSLRGDGRRPQDACREHRRRSGGLRETECLRGGILPPLP